ncbi:MAG TPA: glutathione ABC transporter substrate-binding protein [Thermotogaceae bacterium]|nr:glutathione ABC transporter substrate-binding protein [Thermotogaceae bacterium]
MKKVLSVLVVFMLLVSVTALMASTVRVLIPSDPKTLYPADMNDNPSEEICRHIYDGLVEFDENSNIHPALAKSWELSEDGTVYTFHLVKGVKFHDGTPFNAEAVKVNFDKILAGGLRRSSLFKPIVKEVRVVDDYTVQFVLYEPFGPFLNHLAHGAGLIVSPKVLEQYPKDEIWKHPVGTGPFKFVEWIKGDHIKLAANENYWKGKPKIDEIVFKIVPEDETRVLMLESGDAEVIERVPPIHVPRLQKSKNIDVIIWPSLTVRFVAMNTTKPPFNDKRVRQAVAYAINKDAICKALFRGYAKPADSVIAPLVNGYYSTGLYPYDPEKAKELLKEAGYPNGFETTLYVAPTYHDVGVAVQGQLATVGINAKVVTLEWGTFLDEIYTDPKEAKWGMFIVGWSPSTADADWVVRPIFYSENIVPNGDNHTGYNSPKADELIVKQMHETDPEKRKEILKELQQVLMEDAPWAPIYVQDQLVAKTSKLENVKVLPIGVVIVKYAYFK